INGRRAMGYYTEQELPYYYTLFKTFAIADHYHASTLSQTFPNRFLALAATSYVDTRPANNNQLAEADSNRLPTNALDFAGTPIFNRLDAAGVSWKVYGSEAPYAF